MPGIRRVGVLMVPNTPAHATYLRDIKSAGQRIGIGILGLEVRGRDEIERAFTALTKAQTQGLVVLPNPVTLTHQTQIVELAAKNRLPAMYPWPEFTEIGGLIAYSTNRTEMYRRSAASIHRTFRRSEERETANCVFSAGRHESAADLHFHAAWPVRRPPR